MRTMYAQFSTYKIFEHLELLYEPGFKRLNKKIQISSAYSRAALAYFSSGA